MQTYTVRFNTSAQADTEAQAIETAREQVRQNVKTHVEVVCLDAPDVSKVVRDADKLARLKASYGGGHHHDLGGEAG